MGRVKTGALCRKNSLGNGVGRLCFCLRDGTDAGRLVFKVNLPKRFGRLMTWWVFDDARAGLTPPNAYINGKCVCVGHTSDHIVEYDVLKNVRETISRPDGSVVYRFDMSLGDTEREFDCIFRCWEGGCDWNDVAAAHRAEVFGDRRTVARFELVLRKDGTWTLHAR